MQPNELIYHILNYLDTNLFAKVSIDDLANKFHYNKYYILKLFKRETKYTIISYINKLRIYYSLNDLKNTNASLLRIAIKNGFYSLEYFSETFKKEIGVSPRIYRKMLLNRSFTIKVLSNLIEINNLVKNKNNYLNSYQQLSKKELILSIFR